MTASLRRPRRRCTVARTVLRHRHADPVDSRGQRPRIAAGADVHRPLRVAEPQRQRVHAGIATRSRRACTPPSASPSRDRRAGAQARPLASMRQRLRRRAGIGERVEPHLHAQRRGVVERHRAASPATPPSGRWSHRRARARASRRASSQSSRAGVAAEVDRGRTAAADRRGSGWSRAGRSRRATRRCAARRTGWPGR